MRIALNPGNGRVATDDWRVRALVFALALAAVAVFAGSAQAATPAWKLLAITGPTHLPPKQSETQRLTVEAEGGTFTLSASATGTGKLFRGSGFLTLTTGSATATKISGTWVPGNSVEGAAVPAGTTVVAVSGSTVTLSNSALQSGTKLMITASKEVTEFVAPAGGFRVGSPISGEGVPAGTTVTALGTGTLTLSAYPTANGVKELTTSETTAPVQYNASATELQSALQALSAFGPDSLTVGGGPGGSADHPYFIVFNGGSLAKKDVAQLSATSSLVGQHANAQVVTTVPGGTGTGQVAVFATNIGGAATTEPTTVTVGPLPPEVVVSGAATGDGWSCVTGGGGESVTCTRAASVSPLTPAPPIKIPVEVRDEDGASEFVPATVSGGGAVASASYPLQVVVSADPVKAGIQALWAGAFDQDGQPFTQAGGHPYSAATDFVSNTTRLPSGRIVPVGDLKEVQVDLPPGFLGNPLVTDRCPQSTPIVPGVGESGLCSVAENAVGEIEPNVPNFGTSSNPFKIFNDVPAFGVAAQFATKVVGPTQSIVGSVRSEGDFGIRIVAPNVALLDKIYGTFAVLYGRPEAAHGEAFLVNPTDCAQQRQESAEGRAPATRIALSTWQQPLSFGEAKDPLPLLTGCQALTESWLGLGPEPKKPSFDFQPTTTNGSSPAGATAHLHIPQAGLSPDAADEALLGREQLATSHLKKAVVTLPEGVTVNPSSANGLAACSEAQMGYLGSSFPSPTPIRFNNAPPSCPDASKLGTVEASSPVLEESLHGTIYLAAQDANPFHSLIGLYLVIDSPRFGVMVKLAGEVKPDPNTGQLTATFDNNPQLPVEDLVLHFRGGGPQSELATPEVCGHYATSSALTPWSAEHGEAAQVGEAGFDVRTGCASSSGTRPFSPGFEAGTRDPKAGGYSPMVIRVNRNDGEQEINRLEFALPPGLTGKLAGIPYCPDAALAAAAGRTGKEEQANPSCPAASQLGTADSAAGVGSEPIHVGGKVYLAGPYKGAPISAVVITPAVAGPFDLGNVVIRTPLYIDLETAQITAKSDPIPTILKGIPLKLRSVVIQVDRANFSLNPTNCEPMQASATLGSSNGATATPSNRFQVGECNKLKFKPKLKLSLKGATKRSGHPALKAVVRYPKKGAYANIARAQVGLPHSEFLDQGNLDKVCTQPQLKSATCPKRSVYGHAKAWTPLLDKPLEGPVYIGVGYGHKLPDLVADLNGQVRILLHGKVDTTKHEGIRNTFEVVPDAPVSRFVIELKGGKKYGLLENSENICRKTQRASARFVAQNGLAVHLRPKIANSCKKKQRKAKGKHHDRSQRGRH